MTSMRARTALTWLAAVFLVAIIAGIVVLLTWDFGAYRAEIARLLTEATGRRIAIDGELKLEVGLRPALAVDRVSIGNAPGGSRPAMATIARLEAEVDLLPLLLGELRIDRVTLSGADILLERGADGRGNWELGGASGDAEGGDMPILGELQVRRSILTYRESDRSYRADIETISVVADGPAGPFKVAGSLTVDRLPFTFAGEVETAAERYAFRGLKVTVAGNDLGGNLELSLAGVRPRLAGALSSAILDLNTLASGPETAPADLSRAPLFPDAPLPHGLLTAADAELSFTGREVRLGGLELRNVHLELRLDGGRLTLKPFTARLAGGRLDLQAVIDGRGQVLAVEGTGGLEQADFGALMRHAAESELFAGKLDATLAVAGRGRSLHELVRSAVGASRLLITEGSLNSRYLDYLAADLLGLLPGLHSGEKTAVNCFVADYGIEQGVARSRVLLLDTERMIIVGDGTIDLGRERIDLYLKPRPKDPSLLSLATPIIVRGPLTEPSAMPDPAALGKNAAMAILGGILLPGAGALLPFLDIGAGDHHPCIEAVKDAGPTTAKAQDEPSAGGVGGVIESIGQGIESIGRAFGGDQ